METGDLMETTKLFVVRWTGGKVWEEKKKRDVLLSFFLAWGAGCLRERAADQGG